jgi:hypothetical protein
MKLGPLITHFSTYLPQYTDLFTDNYDIAQVDIDQNTVTITTVDDYSFSNNYVHIAGVLEAREIIDFDYNITALQITCTTASDHGLTMGMNLRTKQKSPLTVTLVNNTNSSLNGDFTLIAVPNRYVFTLQLTSDPGAVDVDGYVVNYAYNRLKGLKQITQLTSNTFSFAITNNDDNEIYPVTQSTMNARGNIRITGAANPDRTQQMYTKFTQGSTQTDKYWLILVYGSEVINKSRNIINSAIANSSPGTDPRLLLIEQFGAIVFAPTVSDLSGRIARDNIENVKIALIKSVMGFPAIAQYATNQQYFYNFSSGQDVAYNTAYLAYQFDFETQNILVIDDMFDDYDIIPMRDIQQVIDINDSGNVLTNEINLDVDPGATLL